jgi:hypothetical protein
MLKHLKNQVKLVLNKTLESIEFFITFPEVIYHSIMWFILRFIRFLVFSILQIVWIVDRRVLKMKKGVENMLIKWIFQFFTCCECDAIVEEWFAESLAPSLRFISTNIFKTKARIISTERQALQGVGNVMWVDENEKIQHSFHHQLGN